MPAPLGEDIIKVLFETEQFKGHVDNGIKNIAPLLVSAGLGTFVPFVSPLVIAGLTGYVLPMALRFAGGKLEIAEEHLQQYKEEGGAKARESPQFPREYDLQYIGQEGNVFSHESIEGAIQSGLEVNKEYPIDEIPQDTDKSIGIDSGFGSSKFAIVVTQLLKKEGKIQVLYAEEDP